MIVFGSRGSDLALTQTRMVAEQVKQRTGEDYRIEVMVTTGDRIQDRPLSGIGVKGLFTQELEDALRSGAIDAAVHSLKDLPVEQPDGITLGAVPVRERTQDVLVARPEAVRQGDGPLLERLADGARIGTSSPRRALALAAVASHTRATDIRGNVPTRADKARRGDYDAVLLAAAGLRRLGLDLQDLVTEELPATSFPPAPGQGALGVQCRDGDQRLLAALRTIHDDATARCVNAERAVLLGLGGGCSMPLGVLIEPLLGTAGEHRLLAGLFGSGGFALQHASLGRDPEALARDLIDRWRPLVGEPLQGRRILVVRPDDERTGLAAALAIAGATVHVLGWTRTEQLERDAVANQAAMRAGVLVFTSARAVRAYAATGADLQRRCFAVGAATATELVRHGAIDVTTSDGRGGDALATLLEAAELPAGTTLAWPCAERPHDALPRRAAALGLDLQPLPVYRLVDAMPSTAPTTGGADCVLFPSPSSVAAFCAHTQDLGGLHAVAIGATTAAALQPHAFGRVTVLEHPTPKAAIEAFAAST